MSCVKQTNAVLLLWMLLGFGSAEGDNTVCAHRDDLPNRGDSSPKMSSSDLLGGEVLDDNRTIRCHSNIYCFTLWATFTDANNKSRISILKQGCWIGEPDQCMSKTCVSNMEPKNNSRFCCCSGDMCNMNFTDSYNPADHTTTPFAPSDESRPLQDNSYKIKTVVISLVSVFSVALVIIVTYLGYRMCTRPRQLSVESLHVVEAPPILPDFDVDDLKLCHIVSKGRYAEVWKGKLEEQEVAVKIYSPHYREYYNNERSLYRLPFMDHEGLVRFFGADERITQDGTPQLMIVLSYVPLGSLSGYLKNNLLDWPTMVRMAHSVAKALSHLHTDIQKGDQFKPVLAHRDINTRNILVRPDLSCVVADLGFAVATMGSKLIKKGHAEVAEQTSLTDVGTLRYMAPELLDGAVNLRDCEASLKQIDMYALGLVLWETAMRCVDLYQGAPVPEYKPPFHAEVGASPTFEEMQMIVVRAKRRPKFPEVWKETNQAVRSLKETIEECWDADAEARLTALCVEERMVDLPNLWAQEWKHRGVTPTLNAMININETSSNTDRPGIDGQGHTDSIHHAPASDLPPALTEDRDETTTPLLGNGHVPTGEISMSSSVSVSQLQRSWLQDHSMSGSTVDTILPPTPGDSAAILPPKTSNLVQERNSTVLRPQQGRNPTVERNTHKCSDEELRVSGNTLVSKRVLPETLNSSRVLPENLNSNLRRDSLSTQSAPPDNPSAESPPDFVGDGMETSLVQNDALSHRNPPIPYVQNQVHGSVPAGRPKVANTSSRGYNRGDRTLREKLSRLIRSRDLGFKLGGFSFFGGGRRHDYARAEDMEVDDLQQEQTTLADQTQGQLSVGGHRLSVHQSNIQPMQTEVRLHNGSAVTRPANLSLRNSAGSDNRTNAEELRQSNITREAAQGQSSSTQSRTTHNTNVNLAQAHNGSAPNPQYPENRLRFAEVGIAKLHLPTAAKQPVRRLQGGGHSKSTSELLQIHKNHNSESCWQETELSANSGIPPETGSLDSGVCCHSGKRRRPNSLSLKGHNYCLLFKPPPPIKTASKTDVSRPAKLSKQMMAGPSCGDPVSTVGPSKTKGTSSSKTYSTEVEAVEGEAALNRSAVEGETPLTRRAEQGEAVIARRASEAGTVSTGTSTPIVQLKLAEEMSDPSEKIRRRVKTPVRPSKKSARLSLYDDRLMSGDPDSATKTESMDLSLRKSSTISKLSNNNNNNNTTNDDGDSIVLDPAFAQKHGARDTALKNEFQRSQSETDSALAFTSVHLVV